MIRYSHALELIEAQAMLRKDADALKCEPLRLKDALGRTLASELRSPEQVPAFDNSAMDGFALKSSETHAATPEKPAVLKVEGLVVAGDRPLARLPSESSCIEIMTGAPIPEGFDSVIKIEDVTVIFGKGGERSIEVSRPLVTGENLRVRGLDFEVGQKICEPGTRIGPEHLMALASLGITELSVLKKPRVALIATGSEITEPDLARPGSLLPGQIRNSSTPYLMASLSELGCEPRYFGLSGDDPAEFSALLTRALSESPDVVITTGAVSRGKHDFIPATLQSLGAKAVFHEVAIRPGKPGFFARFEGGPVFFGMPGNPVSTAVALRFFVGPYLVTLQGHAQELGLKARLAHDLKKPEALRCFYKATLHSGPDGLEVSCHPGQPSFMVSPMLESNSWAVLPETGDTVKSGTWVDVFPLHGRFQKRATAESTRSGGCC